MRDAETTISSFLLREDGILDVRAINPDVRRTPDLIRADLRVMSELTDGVPRPTLWKIVATRDRIEPEAFRVFIAHMNEVVAALAVVADASTEGVLGGFPNAVDSLMLPVRTFSDETEALGWLASHL